MTPLGIFLRKKRVDLSLSLTSMAKEIGVSKTYLHMIEVGYQYPTLKLLKNITKHYNFSEAEYLEMLKLSDKKYNDKKFQFLDLAEKMKDCSENDMEEIREYINKKLNK